MPAVLWAQAGIHGLGGLEVLAKALAKEVFWSGDGALIGAFSSHPDIARHLLDLFVASSSASSGQEGAGRGRRRESESLGGDLCQKGCDSALSVGSSRLSGWDPPASAQVFTCVRGAGDGGSFASPAARLPAGGSWGCVRVRPGAGKRYRSQALQRRAGWGPVTYLGRSRDPPRRWRGAASHLHGTFRG